MAEFVIHGNPPLPSADDFIAEDLPPLIHLLPGDPPLVFVVEGSLLFATEPEFFAVLEKADAQTQVELLGLHRQAPRQRTKSAELSAPNAISLNLAQSCNLSCSYCYADEGRFGGRPGMMSLEVAKAAIDQLLAGAEGQRVTVGFIGGEPFLNRDVLYGAVEHAQQRACETGSTVGFSVTTNGTVLTGRDLDLLRQHRFAVSVSLDGPATVNDKHRRSRNGSSGFEMAIEALRPLLESPGEAKITARATITRQDLRVTERIGGLLSAGFREVGVSPLRTSPIKELALQDQDWPVFLQEMVQAAEVEFEHLANNGNLRFSNLAIALKQLHAGFCKPLPCGSAASYVSVSARGEYFTCHRTIDDRRFGLGDVTIGLSTRERESFLRGRHVDLQQPCRSCWARYLCGGGCHAEVLSAGRSGCDYIRGWLEYCLLSYDRALREFPTLFSRGGSVQ
jgi:uncharacterized protein